MKIETYKLDGKKSTIEVTDKVFSAKINKKLVNSVLYKTNANYKDVMQRQSNKMRYLVQHQKFMLKKAQAAQGMQVEKLQFLLEVVLRMVLKVN